MFAVSWREWWVTAEFSVDNHRAKPKTGPAMARRCDGSIFVARRSISVGVNTAAGDAPPAMFHSFVLENVAA